MTRDIDPWYTRAACIGMAPLFDAVESGRRMKFSRAQRKANAERLERAARVCETCPVREECARDAKPGRDEGVRAGKVLPPIFSHGERDRSVAS